MTIEELLKSFGIATPEQRLERRGQRKKRSRKKKREHLDWRVLVEIDGKYYLGVYNSVTGEKMEVKPGVIDDHGDARTKLLDAIHISTGSIVTRVRTEATGSVLTEIENEEIDAKILHETLWGVDATDLFDWYADYIWQHFCELMRIKTKLSPKVEEFRASDTFYCRQPANRKLNNVVLGTTMALHTRAVAAEVGDKFRQAAFKIARKVATASTDATKYGCMNAHERDALTAAHDEASLFDIAWKAWIEKDLTKKILYAARKLYSDRKIR